jgi:hypothetical protein
MWKETLYLPLTEVAETEGKTLSLIGSGGSLQLQIDEDGSGDYIDIDVREAKVLIAKIQEWIKAKNA